MTPAEAWDIEKKLAHIKCELSDLKAFMWVILALVGFLITGVAIIGDHIGAFQ